MSELKKDRNDKMLSDYRSGKTIYAIAKEHGLSWTRTKSVIAEHSARVDQNKNQ